MKTLWRASFFCAVVLAFLAPPCPGLAADDPPHLHFQLGQIYARSNRWDDAVEEYRKAAEAGDIDAQRMLSSLYRQGNGIPKDDDQAIAWRRKAAWQGNTSDQYSLGLMYLQLGAELYRKAADQGEADARHELSLMCEMSGKGDRFPLYVLAIPLCREAAGQGSAGVRNTPGSTDGQRGALRDDDQAIAGYRKAADQGDADAQYNLGRVYLRLGGEWMLKAADKQDGNAVFALAHMYEQGLGVPEDHVQAAKFYRSMAAGFEKGASDDDLLQMAKTYRRKAEELDPQHPEKTQQPQAGWVLAFVLTAVVVVVAVIAASAKQKKDSRGH